MDVGGSAVEVGVGDPPGSVGVALGRTGVPGPGVNSGERKMAIVPAPRRPRTLADESETRTSSPRWPARPAEENVRLRPLVASRPRRQLADDEVRRAVTVEIAGRKDLEVHVGRVAVHQRVGGGAERRRGVGGGSRVRWRSRSAVETGNQRHTEHRTGQRVGPDRHRGASEPTASFGGSGLTGIRIGHARRAEYTAGGVGQQRPCSLVPACAGQ